MHFGYCRVVAERIRTRSTADLWATLVGGALVVLLEPLLTWWRWPTEVQVVVAAGVILAVVLVGYLHPRGRLNPERTGRPRWTILLAVVAVLLYPAGVALAGTTTGMATSVVLAATTAATVTTLLLAATHLDFGDATMLLVFLLCGVAGLLGAVEFVRAGNVLRGVALLLGAVAVFLVALATLLEGVTFRRERRTMRAVAFLLASVGVGLVGVAFLRAGDVLRGVAFGLAAASLLLGAVPLFRREDAEEDAEEQDAEMRLAFRLNGFALLLGGLAVLVMAVAFLRTGKTLHGIAVLVAGAALLLAGFAVLRVTPARADDAGLRVSLTLAGVALGLLGAASALLGVAFLREDRVLAGVALLLGGVSSLPLAGGALGGADRPRRLLAFLTTRTDPDAARPEPSSPAPDR